MNQMTSQNHIIVYYSFHILEQRSTGYQSVTSLIDYLYKITNKLLDVHDSLLMTNLTLK